MIATEAGDLGLHGRPRLPVEVATVLRHQHAVSTIDIAISICKRRKSSDFKSTHTLDDFSTDHGSIDVFHEKDESSEESDIDRNDVASVDQNTVPTFEEMKGPVESVVAQRLNLLDLPEEIQQNILDNIVGNLGSISSKGTNNGTRNWNNAMRHPRAKEDASLALVTPLWTRLIQERLYRHIRVKGTRESLHECIDWFLTHPHLQEHVRHIEFWVPIWEQKPLAPSAILLPQPPLHPTTFGGGLFGLAPSFETREPTVSVGQHYQLSSQSSSLSQLFGAVDLLFRSACILTIEGGNCKKPPKIRYFPIEDTGKLPKLPGIRTLVTKGAWSLIREESDFQVISSALPNLGDWQCMFSSPKSKAYIAMYKVLQYVPQTLTHLHICMEGFHSKKWLQSSKVNQLRLRHHICQSLGQVMPQLEALTFSGRVCSTLFTSAMEACAANQITKPRLKSVEIVLRNCCRDLKTIWGDGTGIYNWGFIQAFEALVLAATRSLKDFPELNNLRIRFVDLDSPHGFMNPYFHLNGPCWFGIWSDAIIENLNAARPGIASVVHDWEALRQAGINPSSYSGKRPSYIKISTYSGLGDNW